MRGWRSALLFTMVVSAMGAGVLGRRAIRDARGREAFLSRGASARLRAMSLGRTREALRDLTRYDPVVVTVGAVSRSDKGTRVHLVLRNRGSCVLRSFAGMSYGFDARGEPVAIDGASQRVAVRGSGMELAPGAEVDFHQLARVSPSASLTAAHIDSTECADGSRWTRGGSRSAGSIPGHPGAGGH